MTEPLHRVIGIDLGTTYSAVAAYRPDDYSPEILTDPDLEGPASIATPSVVRLESATGSLIVGHPAKNAIADESLLGDTIIEVKREMGCVFDKASLEANGAAGIFETDDPVHVRLGARWFRPQEISGLILMHIKKVAERRIGCEIHDAVVTVPAYFTEKQKKATEEAALLAGLHPRQLIPEPTAAAIAYGVDRAESERRIYLVFDLGGGTFDVSIIETRENQIEVIATAGDQRLGGGDFDNAIVEWIGRQVDLRRLVEPKRLRVKALAEQAKRDLSLRSSTTIDLGADGGKIVLTRADFESAIRPFLDRTLRQVDESLVLAEQAKGLGRNEIDAILLVGGSTRIPCVRQMLLDHFEQEEAFVRGDANPDTLVARGAAILAYRFEPSAEFDMEARPTAEREEQNYDEPLSITLITEHTLGVANNDGGVVPLIPRGTKIPASQTKTLTNPSLAEHLEIAIYQGESDQQADNTFVGTIHLDAVEPRPEGFHHFDIRISLDINGLLDLRVKHRNTGKDYQAFFEQSTRIGEPDKLNESRRALLGVFTKDERTNVVSDHTGPAHSFDLPRPVEMIPAPEALSGPTEPRTSPLPEAVASSEASDIPPEYRRLVKNVRRYLANDPVPDLDRALQQLISAIESQAATRELEEYADRLEDVYDNLRR
ncbi:Hsp70 family protein [Nocardia concava]|uniref:Hsp70 family protein n=1 Tax=Nocardia concava TaxID=257281 RepID=UPI0002FEA6AC|nr:Hsp70 family protein [Nocardia concava]